MAGLIVPAHAIERISLGQQFRNTTELLDLRRADAVDDDDMPLRYHSARERQISILCDFEGAHLSSADYLRFLELARSLELTARGR